MKQANKRNQILYTRIQPKNNAWLIEQAIENGYVKHRGKAKFVDALLTAVRTQKPKLRILAE